MKHVHNAHTFTEWPPPQPTDGAPERTCALPGARYVHGPALVRRSGAAPPGGGRRLVELGWKRAERMLAQGVGTSRIPMTGERAGADCETGMFSYQIKSRTGQPGYLRDWLDRIKATAARVGKTDVLIWRWIDLHGSPVAVGGDQAPDRESNNGRW